MAESSKRGLTLLRETEMDGRDVEDRREQIYYELGERGDKIAEATADVARQVREGSVRERDVDDVRGVLNEIDELLVEVDLLGKFG